MKTTKKILKSAGIFTGMIGCSAIISLFLGSCKSEKDKQEQQNPNIIFIMADDLGWKDVSYMGSEYYETPNIDSLASQGMIFTDAYASAANCAPTRACLMSGQYSPRHGIYTVNNADRGVDSLRKLIPIKNETVLDTNVYTMAEALARAGYESASMGKWHLGDPPDHGPEAQGFDLNVAGWHMGHPRTYFSPYKNPALEDGPEGEYLTDRLTEDAVTFIKDNREKPFFLYLPYYSVHSPHQAKEAETAHFKKKEPWDGHNDPVYEAMIHSVDRGVGRIMKTLNELNLKEETIVIFYSDNGGVGGYEENGIIQWRITSQDPLRGGKGMFYEGGIRVPLVVRWPGKVEAGSRCHTPVISVDFYPTFLDLAGIEKEKGKTLDGKSILPLLKQEDTFEREAIYWHFPAYLQGQKGTFRTRPVSVIRSGDYKLLEFFEDDRLELYNLEKDIGEENDLSDQMPEKTRELHQQLKQWRESVDAPVPSELNPEYHRYEAAAAEREGEN